VVGGEAISVIFGSQVSVRRSPQSPSRASDPALCTVVCTQNT